MTTAVVGVGRIGAAIARHLVTGGERVILAGRDLSKPEWLAGELGARASAATVPEAISKSDVIILAVGFETMKDLIAEHGGVFREKVVVDPSNPIVVSEGGGFVRTLPEGISAGMVISRVLPPEALYAKAFGTLDAESLASGANSAPERTVLFYATDEDKAARAVERLIYAAGFEPVKVGGVADTLRIEVFGDLHQSGGLNGTLPTLKTAKAQLIAENSDADGLGGLSAASQHDWGRVSIRNGPIT